MVIERPRRIPLKETRCLCTSRQPANRGEDFIRAQPQYLSALEAILVRKSATRISVTSRFCCVCFTPFGATKQELQTLIPHVRTSHAESEGFRLRSVQRFRARRPPQFPDNGPCSRASCVRAFDHCAPPVEVDARLNKNVRPAK